MKKIFLLILVSFVPLFLPRGVIHAAPQTVIVSEMVPGSRCVCMWETAPDGKTCASTVPVAERKYTCIVSSGL